MPSKISVSDVDVLIVGGGIAGWSAAWFAARAGREVVVVDEGFHRASDLPVALINPLRGHAGRLVADGVDGMHATFALIDALRAAGHRVVAGRGLFRPLVDLPPAASSEAFWTEPIGARLAVDWHAIAPASLGLARSVPSLYLRDAGWVEPHGLLAALAADSGAHRSSDRVTTIAADGCGGGTVTVASGSSLRARSLLWCGGAWGAALIDRAAHDLGDTVHDALYKPGTLVAVEGRLSEQPMSFGLYVASLPQSASDGPRSLIGPTREGSCATFPEGPVPSAAVGHLEDRVAGLFGRTMQASEAWRGVRLARLSSAAQRVLHEVPALTALGSRGFLMAPLLAHRWMSSWSASSSASSSASL